MLYSYGYYSRVPISWNEFFSKILKKTFIVQKLMISHNISYEPPSSFSLAKNKKYFSFEKIKIK